MSVEQVLIIFVAAISTIRTTAGQLNTALVVYPIGRMYPEYYRAVQNGSTIVFSCTIPGLDAYPDPGTFNYTELYAIVGGVNTTVCSATATGPCTQGSQEAPYTSRSVNVNISTTVGTLFTMTAAVVNDSGYYYCTISAGNVTYTPATDVSTWLQVYVDASQPTLQFVNSSGVFVSGQTLPPITCTGNVGAPRGYFNIYGYYASGQLTHWYYWNYNAFDNAVLESDGTYTFTITHSFLPAAYKLSSNNNNTYFVCYACGVYGPWCVGSSELTIQVQSPVTNIAVNMALYRGALSVGSTLLQSFVQSGTSYTLTVSQGTVITLYCSAQGDPPLTYEWTQVSGQNAVAITSSSSSAVSSTLSIVETLTLQCNATNTISASSPSYETSQIATVDIIVH